MTSGADIVNLAKQSLGVQYVWGGNDLQNGVDCSGLVQQVFGKLGIQLPRVTYNQINSGANVDAGSLRPGDLVFFATESADQPDHVGIYIGGGQFIHAPHTGDVVKVSNLDGYYMNRLIGGRRIPGVTGGSDGGDSSAAQTSQVAQAQAGQRLDSQELAQQYGLSYAFFQSNPELMGLLNQAVADQWSPTKWTAELKNTDWWKGTSETARQAQIQEQTDPATFKAQLNATQEQLRLEAVQMGAVMTDAQLADAARTSMAQGWGQAQVQEYLGNYISFVSDNVMGGLAGQHALAIRDAAYKNGVQLDEQAVKNYAAYIGKGLATLDGVLGQVRQTAAGTYPAFAQQILAGQDMATIASPYVQMMARETGQDYAALGPATPEIKDALNRVGQDKQPNPMSLSEFQTSLRSDPSWRGTQSAQNSLMQTGNAVLKQMGLLA